jgi:hypothetical protein
VSVAANTNNLIDHLFSSFACICVNTFVLDEIGVGDAGQHFSEEGDRFLFELLRIADIAEGDLFEGVACMKKQLLLSPLLILFLMVVARVGTIPLTAYSASTREGLTSFQKKFSFLVENLMAILPILFIHN